MIQAKTKIAKSVMYFLISGLYLYAFYLIMSRLNDPYLWFDEAVQFWISKGVYPWSDPLAPAGGVSQVIKTNILVNMDPGGFSLLLHYWAKISTHHIWLRLLPFMFFTGIVAAFVHLTFLWTKNLRLSLLMGLLPVLIPMFLRAGFEVRAFGMESLGTLLGLIALYQISKDASPKRLLIWSLLLSVFITSRYASIIVTFVVSCGVMLIIASAQYSLKEKATRVLVFGLPLLIAVSAIYFFILQNQNPGIQQQDYLIYLNNNRSVLTGIPGIAFLMLLVLILFGAIASYRVDALKKYRILFWLALCANVLFFVLSFAGVHPWNPLSNRNISMVLLAVVSVVAIAGEMAKRVFTKNLQMESLLVLIFAVLIIVRAEKLKLADERSNLAADLKKVELEGFKKIFVDRRSTPFVRYAFEYGTWSGHSGNLYPDRFDLTITPANQISPESKLTSTEWYATQPKMNEMLQYDLLIAPQLFLFSKGANDKWEVVEGTSNIWQRKSI